ncbi:Hypothetical_protein [Hexamita inflata]|uniref:Hypothetical_protein n=1 Tax=Hexamita inflata TaxID=28002 RepID=A0ABP1J548_9EUKA
MLEYDIMSQIRFTKQGQTNIYESISQLLTDFLQEASFEAQQVSVQVIIHYDLLNSIVKSFNQLIDDQLKINLNITKFIKNPTTYFITVHNKSNKFYYHYIAQWQHLILVHQRSPVQFPVQIRTEQCIDEKTPKFIYSIQTLELGVANCCKCQSQQEYIIIYMLLIVQ